MNLDSEKVARANLNPESVSQVVCVIGNQAIDAELMTPEEGFEPQTDHVVAVQEVQDAEGNKTRRFLRLSKKVVETEPTEVSFFDSHEALIKGVGAVVVTGLVVAGSLFVRRYKKD